MIGERARYHCLLLAPACLDRSLKSAFRQLNIETVRKSYISSSRPKPRPFLPTIENDVPASRSRRNANIPANEPQKPCSQLDGGSNCVATKPLIRPVASKPKPPDGECAHHAVR